MNAAPIVPISSQRSRLHFGRRLLNKSTSVIVFMTCGDIFRIIIALFIPPLGVFTQVGLTQPFWINLVIYLFAVGGLGFPVLFGMWPAAIIHALFVILTRK